ncbi:S28 family serine protease [Streptomyces yaizuensis]|uniref:Tripeptidyl aminopeptidase n=1 Tax=Streptomyces yaizuensis TaxID=2989713 RepID=A0ABQ5NTU9_9ACTN|nr:S28 family serine protease [Streptomyces sp. YSPA8]GLF93792.1 tripeptidyl aminopeptidase [Streptomyces sp. YSPA8]
MRRTLVGAVGLALVMGTVTVGGATAVEADTPRKGSAGATADIKSRLLAIPGMTFISEEQVGQHRFFTLSYAQPVDHTNPRKGTFQQRFSLLHKDVSRPTVFHTSGYYLWPNPERSEPARLIDGNEISLEHRFFAPSSPASPDWSKLNIRQAAADQHRLFTALKKIYAKKWLSTGASKGGMTATYYERFHPNDMDGVVAYVAPNDVNNKEDSAYDRFFRTVGTTECRTRLQGLEREGLIRRTPLVEKLAQQAARDGITFERLGGVEQAYESAVAGLSWGFWQYAGDAGCAAVPADAKKLSDAELFTALNELGGFYGGGDASLADFQPYYYQAGTELGSPSVKTPKHLKGLLKYPETGPRDYVDPSIPMAFKPRAMADIDRWVRHNADRMLFVNGEWDPWAAEPFRLGAGSRDSLVLTVPKASHMADIAGLPEKQRALATARIQRWAGVAPSAVREDPSKAKPLARFDVRLDTNDSREERVQRMLPPR